jgi:hypothetical protein
MHNRLRSEMIFFPSANWNPYRTLEKATQSSPRIDLSFTQEIQLPILLLLLLLLLQSHKHAFYLTKVKTKCYKYECFEI